MNNSITKKDMWGERDIYQEAIDIWGVDIQIIIAIEEMSELIKALCKFKRYGTETDFDFDSVREEIAHVQIVINQMKYVFGRESYLEAEEDAIMDLLRRLDHTKERR